MKLSLSVGLLALLLVGCSSSDHYEDLDQFMAQAQNQGVSTIEPLPAFSAYQVFSYSAGTIRSPFEPPVIQTIDPTVVNNNIRPDLERVKEPLEAYPLRELSLVGYISSDNGFWGLIDNGEQVVSVRVGEYLGQNHGRITSIDARQLELIEIISAGPDYWIERPRVIRLDGSTE